MLYLVSELVDLPCVIMGVARGIDQARVILSATTANAHLLLTYPSSAPKLAVAFRADLKVLILVLTVLKA